MKFIKFLIIICFIPLLSGCMGREPNDTVYVAAMGIDKGKDNNYNITIQFAKPAQISGGASEEGGKGGEDIVENLIFEAPDVYAAVNMANYLISKKFSLSHMKLIVFSEEVAKNGINDIMETLSRSDEVRPDLITAVSRETANAYLENTKPIVEVNPTKYYQLIYEQNNSGGIPKMSGIKVMTDLTSKQRDIVMPLAGVAKSEKSSDNQRSEEGQGEGQQQSGGQQGEGQQQGGGQQQSGDQQQSSGQQGEGQQQSNSQQSTSGQDESNPEKINSSVDVPINKQGFQYNSRDYKAGDVSITDKDKSEALGMAVFKEDKLIAELNEIEANLYNILVGDYYDNYTSFFSPVTPDKAVTVRLGQRKIPTYKIDKNNNSLKINLYLEGDFYSLPYNYSLENDVEEFEKSCAEEISSRCCEFVKNMRDEYDVDVLGIKEKSKKGFIDMNSFNNYNWDEKFKSYNIEVETKFKIRHSGITYREKEE